MDHISDRRILSLKIKSLDKSILLLGPRQTGKTTLIRSLQPDLTINLADEAVFQRFLANAGELRELVATGKYKTIFIDEIQRHAPLLNTVQALLDEAKAEGRPLRFLLTGSSARKLKRGQANLLPGRVLSYELGPFCAAELDYAADTRRGLELGFLPEPYLLGDRAVAEKLLSTYAATYLKEEIQAEALVRNLEGFVRFMNVAAEHSGRFLDFSKISKAAKIPRQNAVRFFEILEDTLIARRVEPYPDSLKPEHQVKRPRYFFFDTGVLNGLLGNFTASNDRKGMLFEHLVFNQICSSAKAWDLPVEIWGFRTRTPQLEIDFIVKIQGQIWAIEAKASGNVGVEDCKALNLFHRYCDKPHRRIIVTPEHAPRRIGEVDVMGWQEMLRQKPFA